MHRWSPAAVLALALLGMACGYALLAAPIGEERATDPPCPSKTDPKAKGDLPQPVYPALAPTDRALEYMLFGPGTLWALGVVVVFAVCFVVIGYGVREWWLSAGGFRPGLAVIFAPKRWDAVGVVCGALLVLALFAPPVIHITARVPNFFKYVPVFGYEEKIFVALVVCAAAGLTCLAFLRRVDSRADDPNLTLARARELLADLRPPLAAMGLMVSLNALIAAAMRTSLLKLYGCELVRAETVIAFGLYYTFCLAALYAPIHLRVTEAVRRAAERAFPAESEPATGLPPEAVQKQRDEALKRIGLGGWEESFRSAILIASPLITATLALVLPSK